MLEKVAKTVAKLKTAKISASKLNVKSPKHVYRTTFLTLNYQPCFKIAYLGKNVKKIILRQKVAQNVTTYLGYSFSPKNALVLKK